MRRRHVLFPLLACLTACTSTTPVPPAPVGWQLAWSDEFDTPGAPDSSKWNYEEGRIRNEELQHYTRDRRDNARVEDGKLVIEARHENFAGATFSSASLISKGHGEFTHARVEVRARLPQGRGVWPAIWMLGTNIEQVGWPKCGEIDIMEFVGFDPDAVHHNVHTDKYNHMKGNGRGVRVPFKAPHADFHVYTVEWNGEKMTFEIDGVQNFAVTNEHTGIPAWPFDLPHYLILNLAIGGSWGGQKGVDEAVFPQRMEIDWVRVYTAKG